MTEVLARREEALSPDDITALLRERTGDAVLGSTVEFRTFTIEVACGAWADVARVCRDEVALAFDLFDCLFGVDARDEGFDVVAVLYSTTTGNRVALRTRCEGGREAPRCPSITDVYRGADWMERETWDMFGIEFDGHPGLEPRLLTVENFDGWPLRKDFHLASRVAKAWPGVKEPVELDEDGNVIERVAGIGDAPGPYDLDKAIAEQAKAVNQSTPAGSDTETEDPDPDADTGPGPGDAGDGEDPPADTGSGEAGAREKAESRRREQAEARRRRAQERGAEDADGGEGDA